jgi:cytochrome c oxidase assembly factor 6
MGWFTSSNSGTTTNAQPSNDGGFIAPDRSAREQCWYGRDAFFKCLDRNDIIDSVKEDDKAKKLCASELKAFEKACADSWVTYFKKRRVFEYQKELTLKKLEAEGAKPLEAK